MIRRPQHAALVLCVSSLMCVWSARVALGAPGDQSNEFKKPEQLLESPFRPPAPDHKVYQEELFRVVGLPALVYTPETRLAVAGMAMMFARNVKDRPDRFDVAAALTMRKQFIADANANMRFAHGKYTAALNLQGRKWKEDYFGLGFDTSKESEQFVRRELRARLGMRRRFFWQDFYMGLFLSGSRTRLFRKPARLVDDAPMGVQGGKLNGIGADLVWDRRDSPVGPRAGFFFHAEVEAWYRLVASDYDAVAWKLDSRRYIRLADQHTIAMQLVWRAQSGEVPFYRLATLGGASLMRGIYEGRFRDRNLIAAQAEYRSPAIWRLSGVAFAGVGAIGPSARHRMEEVKWSAGTGARVLLDRKQNVNIRLDLGVSADDYGVYFSLGEAF